MALLIVLDKVSYICNKIVTGEISKHFSWIFGSFCLPYLTENSSIYFPLDLKNSPSTLFLARLN